MAAPNLLTSTSVTGKTAMAQLTTSTANVLTNASNSNTVIRLDNVILTNYSSLPAFANVVINRSSVSYYLTGNVSIPANSTLVLLGRDTSLFLEEGDVLQANVNANTAVSFNAAYELIAS